MQGSRLVLLASAWVWTLAMGCTRAPQCEVGTNDQVRALVHKLSGEELDTRHECIERSATFPGVIRIGTFYYDHGCRWRQVLVGCQLDPPDAAAKALGAAGWRKADAGERRRLAVAWLREALGEDIVAAPAGATEVATPTADGGLKLRFWAHQPARKSARARDAQHEVTFAADGSPGPIAPIEAAGEGPAAD